MKKIPLLLIVSVINLLAITSFVSAISLAEIDVKTPVLESYCSSEVFLEVEIKNNQLTPENFIVGFEGENINEWIDVENTVFLVKSISSEIVKIPLKPSRNVEGEFRYNVFIYPETKPNFRASRGFLLKVSKVCIEDLNIERIGDTLISKITLGSFDEKELKIVYEIKDSDEQIISTATFSENVIRTKKIEHNIELPENIYAGEYSVIGKLEGFGIEETRDFTIDIKHDLIETSTTVSTLLYKEVTVAMENNGNVPETNVKVTQSTPRDSITGYATNPADCQENGGETSCDYIIPEILPGETGYIIYRIEYWPYWATYALIAVIAVLIVGVSFIRITRPTLKKTSTRKSKNNHSVILHIKNPFRHHLKNVVIRDWVSPLAKFDRKNIHGVKPVMRRSDAGTELIWRLGDIKPKEERMLNYHINTLVEGNLRMPKAYLRFRDNKEKRFRVYSNNLILQ